MLIYQHRDASGRDYQVRRAGRSIRLYTDGVFHTQYNSAREYEGSLWDLLWFPVVAHTSRDIPRILVLGVGGGAVIKKLRHRYPHALIVGVDLNPVHLTIARRFFAVNHPQDVLLEADARRFVSAYQGPRFDVVIDDIFGEVEGEPVKAIALDDQWCQQLLRMLAADGLLISNFTHSRALKQSAPFHTCKSHFAERWQLQIAGYENAIGAFYRRADASRQSVLTNHSGRAKSRCQKC